MNRFFQFVVLGSLLTSVSARAQGLTISHDPIPFAVRGQPLTLKAKVSGAEAPQSVTLYYALFRDAAPFRVPMKGSGLGYYVGTIESSVVAGVDTFSYYIEAQDANGALTETPWYDVPFRKAETKPAPVVMPMPVPAGPTGPAPVIAAPAEKKAAPVEKESNWKTPALIAGGAAVILGGAYAISQGGGGGSSDDGGGGGGATTNNPQGTYSGSVNTCLTSASNATTCASDSMSIVIDKNGVVYSDTIHPGQQLTGKLSGNSFSLVSVSNVSGTNSTINYNGDVVGNRIIGSISGSATSAGGNGTYSGNFTANKQ